MRVYTHDRSHSASSTRVAYTTKESIPSRILMNNPSEAVATSEGNPGPSPLSILDVLRAPTHTELTRERKIDSNPPPKGKRRARGEGSSEPKTVSPRQRLKTSSQMNVWPCMERKDPNFSATHVSAANLQVIRLRTDQLFCSDFAPNLRTSITTKTSYIVHEIGHRYFSQNNF